MGPTWGPSGAYRTQVGPMLAPWTLLSGAIWRVYRRKLSNKPTSPKLWNRPSVLSIPAGFQTVTQTAFHTSIGNNAVIRRTLWFILNPPHKTFVRSARVVDLNENENCIWTISRSLGKCETELIFQTTIHYMGNLMARYALWATLTFWLGPLVWKTHEL